MNKIKLVLDKKGIKQKWLAEQLGKSLIWLIRMYRIEPNQVLKLYTK